MTSRQCERGTVTAEFALVVPAILVLLGLIMGVVTVQRDSIIAQSVAGQAARALGRGESEDSVRARIADLVFADRVVVSRPDDRHVCVSVSARPGLGALGSLDGESHACAALDIA